MTITNKELLRMLEESHEKGITQELSDTFVAMVNRLIHKNFTRRKYNSYSVIEIATTESLRQLINNWHKFDRTKSQNPFAFFVTIINSSAGLVCIEFRGIEEILGMNNISLHEYYDLYMKSDLSFMKFLRKFLSEKTQNLTERVRVGRHDELKYFLKDNVTNWFVTSHNIPRSFNQFDVHLDNTLDAVIVKLWFA